MFKIFKYDVDPTTRLALMPRGIPLLIEKLERSRKANAYQAPETQDFMAVADILYNYCHTREDEEWVVNILKIWRNEEFSLIPQKSVG